MMPRREFRSPMMAPMYSSGVTTSTFITGSKTMGLHCAAPSRKAARPAISNAMTEESTGWNCPSINFAFKSTHGKPAWMPFIISASVPLRTPGMYSLGIAPPLMSLTNSKPSPGFGSKTMFTLANWPEPPLCFLWVYQNSYGEVMVSRYATCGAPTLAFTLNSRFSLSTMISKCSSPIPSMTVWLVSSSLLKRKDGSSPASFAKASIILSESTWVSGSQATLITGSGNSIRSREIGASKEQRVSPVVVSLRPRRATMSPALASLISSRVFECIRTIRPRRSFCFVLGLSIISPALTFPE
mmetsp:Transcript_19542/g.29298  ORF Transcript_19542/g.29298 Transcript_19542/m.29298 type:complete len:299 (+) Transcript_19542:465-1361(+)